MTETITEVASLSCGCTNQTYWLFPGRHNLLFYLFIFFIKPLFHQASNLRTGFYLQMRPELDFSLLTIILSGHRFNI